MSRSILTALTLWAGLWATGCAGDPDLAAVSATITQRAPVERLQWERAPAGCEDVISLAVIRPCVDAPALGALVDGAGRVLCVDAISTLEEERGPGPTVGATWDPTPTPISPVPDLVLAL